MKKVLVLGASGMLGSMVVDYCVHSGRYELGGTLRTPEPALAAKYGSVNWQILDAEQTSVNELTGILSPYRPHYIINCIGVIKPYCKDNDPVGVARAIVVNAHFPQVLANAAQAIGARVIQIATDCVYSGKEGNYTESAAHDALDVYGKTKSLGEVRAPHVLHLRTSIIGPERKGKVSLLEWFLQQKDGAALQGFMHHEWNGMTTWQFAQVCNDIIDKGDAYFDQLTALSSVHHVILNTTVTKYELLVAMKEIFGIPITITPVDAVGAKVLRTLASDYYAITARDQRLLSLTQALHELRNYMSMRNFYE